MTFLIHTYLTWRPCQLFPSVACYVPTKANFFYSIGSCANQDCSCATQTVVMLHGWQSCYMNDGRDTWSTVVLNGRWSCYTNVYCATVIWSSMGLRARICHLITSLVSLPTSFSLVLHYINPSTLISLLFSLLHGVIHLTPKSVVLVTITFWFHSCLHLSSVQHSTTHVWS